MSPFMILPRSGAEAAWDPGVGAGRGGNQIEAPEENEQRCLGTELDPSPAQEKPPYNLKAFNLRISFPEEYPFKPPTVTFTTRIYHPNVDSNGRVCLPITSKENWKPFTKTCQVLEALNLLVNKPELGQPLRLELADQLTQDPELFNRRAEEFTLQFGVDRPS
ncbi:ubiquitin/ISG15-conjugating enzyme E2 L6 isoform X1 [Delphinapterus leucas]|uniref:E2 ubiquitin-conjugating enzyme n=1 Tax=Delphinapterus leucas TaxID=9749 RepID=A0A2Y9PX18_DELLE|nr:ubiquitin/ISG15-conjugating enzyme E2 L6 isoform X1 [Delphinapterus leucas]